MTLRFKILGSSSKGNAALLATEHTKVLIDVGFSTRKLNELLALAGESLATMDAIFLTHEHADHARGLQGMLKYASIPVFANRDTAEAVEKKLKYRPNWKLFETGSLFRFRDLEICNFAVPHDAADPVAFTFTAGEGDLLSPRRTLAWCTDLGYAPRLVQEKIRDADVLVLESNYDNRMLDESTRAWSLKQRIKGRHGHLANDSALELIRSIERPRWQQVYLAHLSEECNCPLRVEACFADFKLQSGIPIRVISPSESNLPDCLIE